MTPCLRKTQPLSKIAETMLFLSVDLTLSLEPACEATPKTVKIVIIEDHKLIRDMLALSCRSILPAADIHLADSLESGFDICQRVQPALIFLDLVLPDGDGFELVPKIFDALPDSKVIALTSFIDDFTVHWALRVSVHGLVDKTEQPLEVLKEAINTVMADGRYFSTSVKKVRASLRSDPNSFDKLLSEHEQKLLSFFGQGLSNEEIAQQFRLSVSTVTAHRRNILGKLGLHSTRLLMNYAIEKGFTRVRRHRV
jgi:DNA-binding NarL/FixJ family response regulator